MFLIPGLGQEKGGGGGALAAPPPVRGGSGPLIELCELVFSGLDQIS